MSVTSVTPPDDFTVRDAAERWVHKLPSDNQNTRQTYWNRITQLVRYCEANDIHTLADLTPWALDSFDAAQRDSDVALITLEKRYRTINAWLEWAASVGLAAEDIDTVLDPPETSKADEVNDERIAAAVAQANIRQFREQPIGNHRAGPEHLILELLWFTGARIGALRGLDRRDYDPDAGTVQFVEREGTSIKPAYNPERVVGLPDATAAVLDDYLDHHRHAVTDDNGREPLLTSQYGRLARSTAGRYAYWASLPCQGGPCPHDRDPTTCDWYSLRRASKCPSSHGAHAIRTGAITHMRNRGWPLDDVAEQVNTSPERIKMHYDQPAPSEEYRERRADLVDSLTLEDGGDAT